LLLTGLFTFAILLIMKKILRNKNRENEEKIARNLKILKAREAGFSYAEVGQMFDITRQRAFQISKREETKK
jgi:hypothetical protein